tara:strand:- start:49 stop:339 length:291 start_codon:yes stop_codon:yes gene_type:complete
MPTEKQGPPKRPRAQWSKPARGATDYVPEEGYGIKPAPDYLQDLERWSLNLYIIRDEGQDRLEENFSAADTYETKEEAVKHCYNLGRKIIDAKYGG